MNAVIAGKMHADEVETDAGLIRRLIAAQFARWADLPIVRIDHAGTDHAIYRLGADMVVRMPRIHWATGQLDKEREWLPRLAPVLPVALPKLLAIGEPAAGYPWPWSVWTWIEGETATRDRLSSPQQFAIDLAAFILALQAADPNGGPVPDAKRFKRGVPLATRDTRTRQAIDEARDELNVDAVTSVWDAALATPIWAGPPKWIHGDLKPDNLLVVSGRLAGVIDFGGLGIGDPAADVMPAWLTLPADARDAFRRTLGCDDATWTRARGWALSVSLFELPYYRHTNPVLAAGARRTIAAVLADDGVA
ncbi:MAG: aminoglycoside phosphotransferase family protein [Acidimicrobiia bacterium]